MYNTVYINLILCLVISKMTRKCNLISSVYNYNLQCYETGNKVCQND